MLVDRLNVGLRRIPAWVVYVAFSIPAPWWLYLGLTGGLGVEPIERLEHELGKLALQLLIATLVVTPLRRFSGVNFQKFRRALGVMAFIYVLLHLLVWLVLDVQILSQIWADIIKRPYITIGMGGFLLLLPLALTSNNAAVRWLGPRWRKLHKLAYPAAILGALHFVWLVKGIQLEPLIYMGIVLILLALRSKWVQRYLAR
ncbi:MAG: protein-methionine-sulfoxide reductase heme-binding subunit MsrQ [Aestuariivita sp.]|nr:protein-methionine-sulfoxide reductase heme-binding subunit MsrQ [Aestuariivita sp.]MCY4201716.1 protein-methionine-sulfoxide reductase heme-binding subunit MsrQ [Aestuariivita sp.]MCY4287788.1 protein-methionine-sulfoxide reductase heme-binding subunit MsrQ [Aestuariivita sp.]MCY4348033.1 protein-methionine-sulfoxide reductase heme-binding subunit MsrQ [Aestuariivita sp.]